MNSLGRAMRTPVNGEIRKELDLLERLFTFGKVLNDFPEVKLRRITKNETASNIVVVINEILELFSV